MKYFVVLPVLFAACLTGVAPAQDMLSFSRHGKLIYVVPLTGKGTVSDPIRPEVTPPTGFGAGQAQSWSWQPSDDGRMAIVEVTATQRSAFTDISKDKRVVKFFERGKDSKEDVEREIRAFKSGFKVTGPEARQR